MKLKRVKYYDVNYSWVDKNEKWQNDVDGGIMEDEMEQIVMNIVTFVQENGGRIRISDIEFTERISFEAVAD